MFLLRLGSRRRPLVAIALTLGVSVPLVACSDGGGGDDGAWEPDGDIEWIVPYSPGGGFDAYARGVADVMAQEGLLPDGVNIVIRNTTPLPQGITQMYAAEPDGQTIGILPMPAAIAQQIQAPDVAQWETSEFSVLGQIDENAYVVYVPADSPYHSAEDLVEAHDLVSVTVEEGSSSAMATWATIQQLGLDATITYGAEGSAEVVAAALRGDADFIVYGSTDLVGFVESGDIRPILFLGTEDQRPEDLEWLEDVPGAEESYPELAGLVTELRMMVAPPDLDPEAEEWLQDTLYEAVSSDAFAEWSESNERPIVPREAADAREAMNAQVEEMERLAPELLDVG